MMPISSVSPLSPAVSEVFERFLKSLQEAKTLNATAYAALAECLHAQTIDHETLRAALFKPAEPPT